MVKDLLANDLLAKDLLAGALRLCYQMIFLGLNITPCKQIKNST
jgi:hypothetical protein